jgi:hypothetical protein
MTAATACPNSSSSNPVLDGLGHPAIREARCGMTTLLRSPTGQRQFGLLKCGKLACRDCGPALKAKRIDGYMDKIGDTPVVRLVVPHGKRWAAMRRRLGRDDVNYLRFATTHGVYVVLAEVGVPAPGGIVTDLREALTSAYAGLPPGGRVSSSRGWKLAAVVASEPSGWTLEAVTYRPYAEVLALALEYKVLARPDDVIVRRQVPDDQWLAFYRRAGFHQPDHRRWWVSAA